MNVEHKLYLAEIGSKGGSSTSKRKQKAARKNAAKARAARKRRYPPCPGYKNTAHRFRPDGRCYNPECRAKYPDLRQEKK